MTDATGIYITIVTGDRTGDIKGYWFPFWRPWWSGYSGYSPDFT